MTIKTIKTIKKNNLLSTVVFFIMTSVLFLSCSDLEATFYTTFGGPYDDVGLSVQQTKDEGYIVTGGTHSYGAGGSDVWLIKTDSNGKEEWNKTFGESKQEWGISVQQTSDSGYIITGGTNSYGAGKLDVWLIKTDSKGNEEWNKTFGGPNDDLGVSVQQASDGGYIVTGVTTSYGSGGSDVWLIKTDSKGNEEWNKTFGGDHNDAGNSVRQSKDGGYIITGYKGGTNGDTAWLIKTDPKGNEEWNKTFGSLGYSGNSVRKTNDGGYIITGRSFSNNPKPNVWLIKTDSKGNAEWKKRFLERTGIIGKAVQQTTDGGYIIITGSDEPPYQGSAFRLIKTDSEGNEEWQKELYTDEGFFNFTKGSGNSVQQTKDGGFISVGIGNDTIKDTWNIQLFKTDSKGNSK